jgi:hypothetical protein
VIRPEIIGAEGSRDRPMDEYQDSRHAEHSGQLRLGLQTLLHPDRHPADL